MKNGHKIENIPLDQFYNSQKINESLILCNNCNKNNKSITHEKLFYICLECKQNLCPLCNSIHNKNHNIIDYNKKNYICNIHNDSFISYCQECKINLCMLCDKKHNKKHEIIDYKNVIEDEDEIKEELNKFKNKIDSIKNIVKNLIYTLNKVCEKYQIIYEINNDIINNYQIKNKNYEYLKNIVEIKNNIQINENNISNIFNIINTEDMTQILTNILDIHKKNQELNTRKKEFLDLKIYEYKEILEMECIFNMIIGGNEREPLQIENQDYLSITVDQKLRNIYRAKEYIMERNSMIFIEGYTIQRNKKERINDFETTKFQRVEKEFRKKQQSIQLQINELNNIDKKNITLNEKILKKKNILKQMSNEQLIEYILKLNQNE